MYEHLATVIVFFSGLLLVLSVSFAVFCSLSLTKFVEKVPYRSAARNTHRKPLSKKDRIEMPVKEVQHECVSLNTFKRPFSKKNRIKIVVKKCHTKVLPISPSINAMEKGRIELLDEKLSYKSAGRKTVKNFYQKCTVQKCCPKHC